jgi:oxygen-independent coproporphyrinogen-3 oxidase
MDLYIEALAAEFSVLGEPRAVATLFIGGGTPTYLDVKKLERMLRNVRDWLLIEPGYEFTIEANPNSLTSEKIGVLKEYGVNRISLGAQTFQPSLLRTLERDHEPGDVFHAVAGVRGRIDQVSLDLIFGVPGQTLSDWEDDLRQALALDLDHISTYGLTFEKGTRLWKQRQAGDVAPMSEETELAMYVGALDILENAGFEQYEISSHARPGGRCRHNQVYWANEAYWGFGLGAARYVDGRREINVRSLSDYIRRALAGEPTALQSEELEPKERARETMALQMRRAEGIHRPSFHRQTGFELDDLAGQAIQSHVRLGFLTDDGANVRLTRQGKCVADSLIRNLM